MTTLDATVDEIMVRNQVVVTVEGNIKHYPISQLGLDFENSSDEEILSAVANVVREELDLEMPTGSFVVSRSADNQNFSIHSKTELGESSVPDWMDEAMAYAVQCWHDSGIKVKDREKDILLVETVANRIAAWMDTAAQNQRNTDYYRGLLERCGKSIGDRAFIADDGTRSEDVLCAKIPEIIETDYVNGSE